MGQPGFLTAPLFPLAGWAVMRATTPAEGMIATKLSSIINRDTDRFLPFLLLWFLAGLAGVIATAVFAPGQKDLDAFMIAGGGIWFVVLLFESVAHGSPAEAPRPRGGRSGCEGARSKSG